MRRAKKTKTKKNQMKRNETIRSKRIELLLKLCACFFLSSSSFPRKEREIETINERRSEENDNITKEKWRSVDHNDSSNDDIVSMLFINLNGSRAIHPHTDTDTHTDRR